MIITLQGERPRSLNAVYQRVHWAELLAYARQCADAVTYALASVAWQPPAPPVVVTVTAHMPRAMDSDNLAVKPYIDALRRQGVIPDDTPGVVAEVRLRSVPAKRRDQRVEIEIEEVTG